MQKVHSSTHDIFLKHSLSKSSMQALPFSSKWSVLYPEDDLNDKSTNCGVKGTWLDSA